ncbi:MAG TPA: hypothetical protein VNT54_15695 [Solirubrobacteraceae bacterium]|nr:hypothetical protein [Solirubrobacteraceae bacterium]
MRLAATAVLTLACATALGACGTSEEDEVRAVVQEFRRALDEDDGTRACRLLTARAARDVTDCPRNIASIDPGAADDPVVVDGERATVARRISLVKVDGSWRIDSLGSPERTAAGAARTAAYERCWRAAGARIATSAAQLAFAAADMPVVAVRADRVSAKGGDWRIFYTLPPDGRDPGLAEVIADPTTAGVVAYVRDASANSAIVERARACRPSG